MLYRSLAAAIVLALSATMGYAQSLSGGDFVRDAASSSRFMVKASQIAVGVVSNAKLKEISQTIISDQKAANKALKAAAAADGLKFTVVLDAQQNQALESLKGKGDQQIRSKFLEDQVKAHEAAIALLTTYTKSGDSERLKAFATETLPKIQKRLDMMRALEKDGTT